MAYGMSHGQDRQAKSQCDAKQADTDLRKTSGNNCAAAAGEGKPKSPHRLGGAFLHPVPIHVLALL
jgi:hypothetical protein